MDQNPRAVDFGQMYAQSLAYSGKSGRAQTRAMGVSANTHARWCSGKSAPYLWDSNRYFAMIGINPLWYYVGYLHPEIREIRIGADADALRRAMLLYWQQTTEEEVRMLHYMIFGSHGYSLCALFRLGAADSHLPMESRVGTTDALVSLYTANELAGLLISQEDVMPSMEIIRGAVDSGKTAVVNGHRGYIALACEKEAYAGKIGTFIASWRKRRRWSQENLAWELHIHTDTLRSWEREDFYPDLFQLTEVCRVLGVPTFRAIYGLLYPHPANAGMDEADSPERLAILEYLKSAPEETIRILAFMILGQHGGSWHCMLHKFSAFLRLPPVCRMGVALNVIHQYEMAASQGRTVCSQNITPSIGQLREDMKSAAEGLKK